MIALDRVDTTLGVLQDALERFRGKIALACSFGGSGGMVLLDLVAKLDRTVPVYFLDTGLLFPETYALVQRVRTRYGIDPVAVVPKYSVAEQAALFGEELWTYDPDTCCDLRKLQPQKAFLSSFDAWLSGVRRDQGGLRDSIDVVSADGEGKTRIAPLADWSKDDVAAYVAEHDVPVNVLGERGFPSAGCTHCTRAVLPGEDPRAARWPGFAKTECGLHSGPRVLP